MSTRIAVVLGLVATFSAAVTLPAQDQQGPQLEVYEISAKRKPKMKGVPLFGNEGLEIKLATKLAGKSVIELDTKESKITSWTDDTGTDLSAGAEKGFFFWARLESSFGNKSPDLIRLTLRTKTLPARKAGRIQMDASVVLLAAKGTGTAKAEVALTKGTEVKAGPVPLKIRSAKKPQFGDSKIQVEFESNESMAPIKEITFLDAKGAKVKSQKAGSGSFGFGGKKVYTMSFGLDQKLDKVTVQVTFHKDIEKVVVPVKLDVGLGL